MDPSSSILSAEHKCGFCSIVGQPNVGKSTLLNRLIGSKVAIVTPKPQTTRNRLMGIKTLPQAQMIFVDTPGIHKPRGLMNRRMVETALKVLNETDLILFLVDSQKRLAVEDEEIARTLLRAKAPTVVVLNKVDLVKKEELLPLIEKCVTLLPGREVVPVSALKGENIADLLDTLLSHLPAGPSLFPEDELTEQTERFLAQEIIREKLFTLTRQEVPYATAVVIEEFQEKPQKNLIVIRARICVERPSQKAIIIGERGGRIKEIGRQARLDLEAFFATKVFLELFVKVEEDWSKNSRLLTELGI
jgi:GTPase